MKLCEECKKNTIWIGDLCDKCYGEIFTDASKITCGTIDASKLQVVSHVNADLMTITQSNKKEIIKITNDGEFYYQGRLCGSDQEVYEGFKNFLAGQGLIKDYNADELHFMQKCYVGTQSFLGGAWMFGICGASSLANGLYMTGATLLMAGLTYYAYRKEAKKYR